MSMSQPNASRRYFLKSTAGGTLTLPALIKQGEAQATSEHIPVIDTHLHCFAGKDDDRFPYHRHAPYRPDKAATPHHLLSCSAYLIINV